jgi:hypothetical protein
MVTPNCCCCLCCCLCCCCCCCRLGITFTQSQVLSRHSDARSSCSSSSSSSSSNPPADPSSSHTSPAQLSLDESLARITLPSIPAIRTFANAAAIDVFLYLTQHKQKHLLAVVAEKLNETFSRHKSNPMFSGMVSIVAHSLGSVICFDLLFQNETGKIQLIDRPSLNFQPLNLFALGSPIGVFSLFRDYHQVHLNPNPLGQCRLYNIYHPLDPVSFRLEPLMFDPYVTNFVAQTQCVWV